MKPERTYLDELNTTSKSYKVKVKVIEKGRAKVSPKKGILYQTLLLEDEKGNKMRGALFGDQIEGYEEVITYKGQYEIANAPIKPLEDQWKYNLDELDYQMSFGRQTVIQPVNAEAGPVLPDYLSIASVPRAGNRSDKYDVLGIVLYVEEKARPIAAAQNRENLVREIVIADHSTDQPLIISAWNDLAGADCDSLSSWAAKFTVVGFTALRATPHKGFSLASSMSTTIIHDPKGDRANALKEWAKHHQDILADRQARVLDVRNPPKERVIMTIDTLKLKKAYNTLQEERCWLRVLIPNPDINKVNAYLGCSNCGKRTTSIPIGKTYACSTCSKKDSISSHRVTFNFDVSDGTGTMPFTTFTKDSEKLFRMSASELYQIKESGDYEAFKDISEMLRMTHFLIKVGPTTALSRNKVLQWSLKTVIIEDEDIALEAEDRALEAEDSALEAEDNALEVKDNA